MNSFFARPAASASLRDGLPVYGRKPANLRRFHTALGRLRAGTYRPKVLFLGDSKTLGGGAGTGPATGGITYTDGAAALSKPALFARMLADRGIPASRQSFVGSGVLSSVALYQAYDPRLSDMSGWSGGNKSLGGPFWASSGTTPLTFTPQGVVDTVDIFAKTHAGDGVLNYTIDADATVLGSSNGSSSTGAVAGGGATPSASEGFRKTTLSVARGTHAIKATRASGGFVSLLGMIAKDSTVPAVDVVNAGAYGTVSSYHASLDGAVWNAASALAVLAPDLVVVQLGTNDLRTGVAVDACLANLADVVAKAQGAGADVVVEVPTFGAVGGTDTEDRRAALRQGLISLGASTICMVLDHDARFVSYASGNALGLFRDGVPHETASGYADEAQALVSAVLF